MIRPDLKGAGIDFADAQGKRFDFHAIRGQFATMLCRSGVTLAEAQQLMRQSDPALTANIYTKLDLADLSGAVSKLPALPRQPSAELVVIDPADAHPVSVGQVTGENDCEQPTPTGVEADFKPGVKKRKPPFSCGKMVVLGGRCLRFISEPPRGLEPWTYALRKHRSTN